MKNSFKSYGYKSHYVTGSKFVAILSKMNFWRKKNLSQNTSIKTNGSITNNFFFALRTKENGSKDVSVTDSQNLPIWNKWLLH